MANSTQKIIPNLWCNGNAKEMAEFYVSILDHGKITGVSYYPKSKAEGLADFQENMAGKELTVDFEIYGYKFTIINAGPEFKPNPSISFFINCESKEEVDVLWARLSGASKELMPLDAYPFSERYCWIQDRFGVSWQLIYGDPNGEWRPKIMPSLMFTDGNSGKAEEAMKFYTSVFNNAKIGNNVNRYPAGGAPNPELEGKIMYADFTLENQWFAAMDSGHAHDFTFNEAISLLVNCEDQPEIDRLWEKLSDKPESEVCGWLKDKYGVSWQIAPKNNDELMFNPDGSTKGTAFAAMMRMKKLNIAELEKAGEGR